MNGNTEIKKRRWKKPIFITAISLISALILISVAFFIYVGNFYEADEASVSKFLGAWELNCYKDGDGNTVFKPDEAKAGFIFYPGGKVEADAYKPLMSAIADRGILCVLVDMPFNLAVFDINAADGIREQYPEITEWYIGGHSLGGSMAASYLSNHPNDFYGLVLLGSYSTEDLSGYSIDVLSVYGSEDGVMNREKYEEYKKNLPSNTLETVIDGGCHAYFGMYGEQKGDGTPTVTNEDQINKTADEIAKLSSEGYFVATVVQNDKVIATPYLGDKEAPDGLEGIFYSAAEIGGRPKGDGTGSIWLRLEPVGRNKITRLTVKGEYTDITELGKDIYRIDGVSSDLTVTATVKKLLTSSKDMIEGFGYGISEEGELILNWNTVEKYPLRHLELTYKYIDEEITEYIDPSADKFEGISLTENIIYSFSVRAIGYDYAGEPQEFDLCYMPTPKEVAFPRVEIITENYNWPTFDVANSPDKYWGQGIRNAEYEQCVMTVYNENNVIVYDSALDMEDGNEFLGAKMKVRGNTSATQAIGNKHPYKIKLDAKADLLEPLIGRPDNKSGYADKNWLLLNYGEDGYRIAGDAIADAVGTAWSPDYCYVNLYVNGDYRGLYILSESIKEGNGEGEEQWRVPIDSDGYLFECDAYWWNESLYFNTPMTQNTAMFFTFKYPDADILYTNSPEVLYIKDYMTRFEEALKMNDESYSSYIGVHSFAKWLLVSDYLSISDAGGCNIYLYKADATNGTKVMMGPNWDFDSWMGDVHGLSGIRIYWNGSPFYYPFIIQKPYFQAVYNELFEESKLIVQDYVDEAFNKIDMDAHSELLAYDSARYGVEYKELSRIKAEFDSWFEEHIAWMDTQFN